MAQILRLISDTSIGGFTTESGSTTNLYASLDESVASDSDYIISNSALAYDVYKGKLTTTVTDPLDSNTHTVEYRVGTVGSVPVDVEIRLLQGATEIAYWKHFSVAALTTFQQTLTTTQADSITDYTDLYLEIKTIHEIETGVMELLTTIPEIRNENIETERTIQEIRIADGKLWPSYGEYGDTGGARELISVDPVTGEYTVEVASVNSDYTRTFQASNGNLFVTHHDNAVGTWPSYTKRINGVWSEGGNDVYAIHNFDFIEMFGNYYMCGSTYSSAGSKSRSVVWKSTNGGANWSVDLYGQDQTTTDYLRRFYMFIPLNGVLWVAELDASSSARKFYYTTGGVWTEETNTALIPYAIGTYEPYHTRYFDAFGYLYLRRNEMGAIAISTTTGSHTFSNNWLKVPKDSSSQATAGWNTNSVVSAAYHEASKSVYWFWANSFILYRTDTDINVRAVAQVEKFPVDVRSLAIIGNTLFVGTSGGQIWKSSSKAVPTTHYDEKFKVTSSTTLTGRGWTIQDASTTQFGYTGGHGFTRRNSSTTGGSWGVPRIHQTNSVARSNTLRLEIHHAHVSDTIYFNFGFYPNTSLGAHGTGALILGREGGVMGRGVPGTGIVSIYDVGGKPKHPGHQYLFCPRATGGVMYIRGWNIAPPYDWVGTTPAKWLPIAMEHLDTSANLYAGMSHNGSVAAQSITVRMVEYDGPAHTGHVEDIFDRANSTTTLGNADTGETWAAIAGTWGIDTNQAYSTTLGGTTNLADIQSDASDGIVTAAVSNISASSYGGVIFRSDGTDQNYWRAYYDGTNFKVDKVVGGSVTNVNTTADTGASGIIQVTMYGSKISVHKGAGANTVATLSIDDAALQTNTRHGLYSVQTAANIRFNNFYVFGPLD